MNILFLGTGAADWKIEKRVDGEFFRRLSSALIDGKLLIDPGPHIFDYTEKNGCPELFDGVDNILVTHSHGDHLNADTVRRLCQAKPRRVFCDKKAATLLGSIEGCSLTVLDYNSSFYTEEYRITPLNANHSTFVLGEQALIYLIESDEKCVFYGLDSAWIPYESWVIMKSKKFDCMVFEVTLGDKEGDYRIFEHNNIGMVEMMLQTVKACDMLNENALVIGSHFSKHAHECHEKLSKRLASFGMIAAYDGYEAEF